jgi:hypothetical protein
MEGRAARYLLAASSFVLALGGTDACCCVQSSRYCPPDIRDAILFVNSFKGLLGSSTPLPS